MKKIVSLIFLLSSATIFCADPSKPVTPKFTIRSQGTNAVRRMVNSTNHVMLADMDKYYGTLSFTPEYTASFNSDDIAKCLFGDSLCKKGLKIQGSRVTNRDEDALLADYFYLPTDFDSEVCISPSIKSFNVDVNFFLGLDKCVEGLYFFLQFPLTSSKWDLNFCEKVNDRGKNNHDGGYFSPSSIDRNLLLDSFSEYARGVAPGAIVQTGNSGDNLEFTTRFNGLGCAKMLPFGAYRTLIAEVRTALGYNFLLDEDYHLGLNVQVVAPTGNNVGSDFLFLPQVGNDNHWEFGGAISGHYTFWRSEEEDKSLSFYLDANLTHMFKNSQRRCFDLCGKPLSRYMLAQRMTTDITDNLVGGANNTTPTHQFDGVFAPVANVTSLKVDVSVGVQADIVAMFNYTSNNLSWDLGYNFWARSCEKIKKTCGCPSFESNTWALKGDAHVFGYMSAGGGSLVNDDPVALSATMSKATINGGDNFGKTADIAVATAVQNLKVDAPEDAKAGNNADLNPTTAAATVIQTSIQPVIISECDINFAGVKGISHKVFTHLAYAWADREKWVPYVGGGFEIEWASDSSNCKDKCATSCDTSCGTSCKKSKGDCVKCGLDQWGVMLKVGASY